MMHVLRLPGGTVAPPAPLNLRRFDTDPCD